MHDLILLGLVCLAAPWLATLAGSHMPRKPFDLISVAGVFFLLAAGLGMGGVHFEGYAALFGLMIRLSFVLGFVALLVGALWCALEVVREPEHRLAGH